MENGSRCLGLLGCDEKHNDVELSVQTWWTSWTNGKSNRASALVTWDHLGTV